MFNIFDKTLNYNKIVKICKNNNEDFNPSYVSIINNPTYIIRRKLYDINKKYINKIKGNVLDIGCGSKPYEELFVNATNYVGLDTKYSGHVHKNESVDVFYNGKVFPFENNSFDNAVCFQVLEHVDDIDLFIKEIKRVVAKNGYILFSMPFIWEEHELPFDFRRYTYYGIKNLLNKHNLSLINYEKYCDGMEMIPQFINIYLRKFNKNQFLYILVKLFGIMPMNILAIIFSSFKIKFDTLYIGHVFTVKNNK